MKLSLFHIVRRSVFYNLKGTVSQILIIILLTGVITGSLMTGKSVRNSLRQTSFEKLGSTGIMISSGIRYFDPTLVTRMASETGIKCIGVLELEGYCQHFTSGQTAPRVKIYAIENDFFSFQGNEKTNIEKGNVAVNEHLANYLGLKEGDELIIRFNTISDIPANVPFAPEKETATSSLVLKAGYILKSSNSGNFSLGISQIAPLNIFINRSDLTDANGKTPKINRLLFDNHKKTSIQEIYNSLCKVIKPEDTGLSLRLIPETGGYELISDRIFIDQSQLDEVKNLKFSTFPVITYLANSISKGKKSTPYSFISALDPSLYEGIPEGNGIIINKWLAEDLNAGLGDTLELKWYSPDQTNHLAEEKMDFVVSSVVKMQGIWSDSLLMPEFPGIAGSKSCTDWDAGVEINMNLIRNKDEEYWNKFGGTPKAFINYEKGRELWANNFGPATSIRFKNNITEDEIREKLNGFIDPGKSGFTLSDLPQESIRAADESVDFSTLFLSLGFFIILSALILLILVVSTFYESKKNEVKTFFSIGYKNGEIEKLLFLESGITAVAGAGLGALAGGLFNLIVIKALNSVWQGAVQTNTLISCFDPLSLVIGFFVTVIFVLAILKIKSSGFLKYLSRPETGKTEKPSAGWNLLITVIFITITIILVALSFIIKENSTVLSYSAGVMVFATSILSIRQFYLGKQKTGIYSFRKKRQISDSYYSFNPSQAIAPVLFLAAGLFAVIITGVNRMTISDNMLKPSGGTGGFLLWGESSVPVKGSLTSKAGRKEYGLEDPGLSDLSLVQARKTSGNDASCLNLNHITSPPLLGIDPSEFIKKGSFSFAVKMKGFENSNPWQTLDYAPANGTIYGIADQTVLQYGLKIKPGDTLKIRAESGQILNVIISAGLKSSVFQGYVIIGSENFSRFFPSVPGSQFFLVDGDPVLAGQYRNILTERLSEFGVHFEPAAERLASFFVVTNTYLSVFTILGGIGMILGVAGLGLILIRNFNQRKRDFGLMLAEGYSLISIRWIVFAEHVTILIAGIITGLISALVATRPSIMNETDLPWKTVVLMILLILATGLTALAASVRSIQKETLITRIRKE
jgi:ABC-type antimicrobial peptide transport system permease subunit